MKKIFSFLLLGLLCSIGTTWASTVDDLTSITSSTTIVANTLNGTSALDNGALYADGKVLCLGGCGYSDSKGSTEYDAATYQNVYQIKSNRQLALKIGFNATVTVVGSTNSNRAWRIGTTSAGNEVAASANGEDHVSGVVDGSSEAQVVYINASSDLYIGAIIITANSSPSINAPSVASIKARKSNVEAEESIAVSGSNLTGNTLTATLSPAVAGLSVTLDETAITAGAISTNAVLHYTQTVNASGSTTLTLSDGTTSKDVTVNYVSKVIPAELVAINSATTFDLTTVGTSGLEEVTEADGWVVLSDAGSAVPFADNFAVAASGAVVITWRNDAIQGPRFKFKTTVPGTVTVRFGDVGKTGTRPNRYVSVNDVLSDVSSNTSESSGIVTCSPIFVAAGEVIIKGQKQGEEEYTTDQVRVYEVTFTPVSEVSITPASDKSTYVSAGILDFAAVTPAGLVAYVASNANDDEITLTQATAVPAGTPLVLIGTTGTEYTVPVIASASAPAVNHLMAGTGEEVSGADKYVLSLQNAQFVFASLSDQSVVVPVGKAYLDLSGMNAAPVLRIIEAENGATNINNLEGVEAAVKFMQDGKLYIMKNGVTYNVVGAVVK